MRNESSLKLNLAIFAYVVVAMLFCANSSPFINTTGTDSSVFRVMGRAMVAGKIMYKDVFDHKGLYLYVINALGVLITGKSLIGLFILECVFMFLCARTVYSILLNYADRKKALIGTQIFMLFALLRGVLEGGNLTEEYGLLFQVLSVYILVKDDGKFLCLHTFLHGVCAGIVIFLRPNIVMMWGGIAVIAGYEMLRQKKFARLAGNITAGISGVMIGIAPAMIYALMTDSLSDIVFGMFGYNFMYLSAGEGGDFSLFVAIRRMLRILKPVGISITLLLSVIATSFVLMLKKRRDFLVTKYYFAMLIMTLVSVALSGRRYGHYFESLVPFCIPFAYWAASKIKSDWYKFSAVTLAIIMIVMGVMGMRGNNMRKILPIDEFVKRNQPYHSENERVLVTHRSMFYNVLGVIPQEKYFYIPSNKYDIFPEPRDAQVASILSGVNDVIIVVRRKGENDIYPETGKSREINEVLEQKYDLLYYDDKWNATMYGKKRN